MASDAASPSRKVSSEQEEYVKSWYRAQYQITMRALEDEGFKKQLLADPAAVFARFGVKVAPGLQVKVVEGASDTLYLTLPPAHHETRVDLKDSELHSPILGALPFIDDFDIYRKHDAAGTGSGGPGTTDNDYDGDPHTKDHGAT